MTDDDMRAHLAKLTAAQRDVLRVMLGTLHPPARRRRPCPTALPGAFVSPGVYSGPRPSPCDPVCVCCSYCRGEHPSFADGICTCTWKTPVKMPIPGDAEERSPLPVARTIRLAWWARLLAWWGR